MKKIIILSIFVIFFIINVKAQGCCFYEENGLCSERVSEPTCTKNGGLFTEGSCRSKNECSKGCCFLGLSVLFTTKKNCEFYSAYFGFNTDWREAINQEQCFNYFSQANTGACVYNDRRCSFIEKNKCVGGKFHENISCSHPSLNTTCVKTNKTKCFQDGNVYFLDSCGNRDSLFEVCNYDEGKICKQKNSNNAYCGNVGCIDKEGNLRMSGESWCIGLDGKIFFEDIRKLNFTSYEGKKTHFKEKVGSIFYRQICIDGEIITENCMDYRRGICIPDANKKNAKCVENPWDSCLDANLEEPDPITNKKIDESKCNTEFCYVFNPNIICTKKNIETNLNCDYFCNKINRRESFCFFGCNYINKNYLNSLNSINFANQPCLYVCVEKKSKEKINYYFFKVGEKVISSKFSECFYVCDKKTTENERRQYIEKSQEEICEYNLNNEAINNLNLELCLPKISPGDNFNNRKRTNICSIGDYNKEINFFSRKGFRLNNEKVLGLLIDYGWSGPDTNGFLFNNIYSSLVSDVQKRKSNKIPIEEKTLEILNERCSSIGDCGLKNNWLNFLSGTKANFTKIPVKSISKKEISFIYPFECKSWNEILGKVNCSLCGSDGLPCTEYKCGSIGKNCGFRRLDFEKGLCYSKDDLTPPEINIDQDPKNPIPPFSSVKIKIETNEDSYCKFDLTSGRMNIENMKYETTKKIDRIHEFILSLPGKIIEEEDIKIYPFINRDGKYSFFIMCEDLAGNVKEVKLDLDVMQTPDKLPPSILDFIPPTNSYFEFNKKEKKIKFRLSEPAECYWSLENKGFEEMLEENEINENKNKFSCDTEVKEENIINGYWCEGNLISEEIGKETKFFINCKDQPWLEEKEDEFYSRNENDRAIEYVLKPSKELLISNISLKKEIFIELNNRTVPFNIRTSDGAENGKAICKWRLAFEDFLSSWKKFNSTNASLHSDNLFNINEGTYTIEIFCEDIANNKANLSYEFNLLKDNYPPKIIRIYNDKGFLKIVLDENSSCMISEKNCDSVLFNGTRMEKVKERELRFKIRKGENYFIRCEDNFRNSFCYNNIFIQ
ncbi:MAG: hypothetical protein QXG18_02675 [Candidatus Pacearchaeota archaeon]